MIRQIIHIDEENVLAVAFIADACDEGDYMVIRQADEGGSTAMVL